MTAKSRIDQIKIEGYDLDFGDVFNKSFENYKQIALHAGLAMVLFTIVFGGIAVALMGAFWGFSSFAENMAAFESGSMSTVSIIVYLLIAVVFSGLVAPFTAGVLKMAHHAAHNLDFSAGTVLDYYKSPYFKDLFVSAVIIAFFSVSLSTILKNFDLKILGMFLSYVIAFFTFLTIPLIVFGNLNAVDAIKGSLVVVSKQIFLLLGLLIVALIVAALGIIGFCIGIIFTIPFLYSTYYCIYDAIIGTNQESELDQIGTLTE